jgi:hypothetical protein
MQDGSFITAGLNRFAAWVRRRPNFRAVLAATRPSSGARQLMTLAGVSLPRNRCYVQPSAQTGGRFTFARSPGTRFSCL